MRNPLLPDGRAINRLEANDGGLIVTGQNGVGKSTLLRGIGLKIVLARAFGHCHTSRAERPDAPVLSSLQIEDSLQSGDSFYVTELKRARQLLDAAAKPAGAIVLIDEMFSGTNHLEAVAAASSVLDELAARALVVVSSHHLQLVPLLRESLVPVRVVWSASDPDQVVVEAGVLAETNGLSLLESHRDSRSLADRARGVAAWLAGHMVEPTGHPTMGDFSGGHAGRASM